MASAVADATLNADNKWSGYFFDDSTNGKADISKEYYQNLSKLQDDKSYSVKIYCPTKGMSSYEDACSDGQTWASTQAFGSDRHITFCPIWFDGINEDTIKEDSSVVKANCPKGAKGEKNWQQISAFKGIKSFTALHEMTHLNYATASDKRRVNIRARDYAYARPACKKLRDGTRVNQSLCKGKCDAALSFRNADTLAFIAAGIYWESVCAKDIAIEPTASITETLNPKEDDTNDAGPDEDDSGTTTTSAMLPPTTPGPIGPLTSCSLVEYVSSPPLFLSILGPAIPRYAIDQQYEWSSPANPTRRTTLGGTIAAGPQTYCTCGSIIAGINTVTSGSVVASVCAGSPYPTVASSTIKANPPVQTTKAPSVPCKNGMYSDSSCAGACGTEGECKSGSTALGQLYYYCDCP
ncbi:MAG: hypothetical protein Q9218_005599 [Villophora microphyllina]